MEETIQATIAAYMEGLKKAGNSNVTVNAADILKCFEHLTGKSQEGGDDE